MLFGSTLKLAQHLSHYEFPNICLKYGYALVVFSDFLFNLPLKVYSHKTKNFKSVFLLLCSPVNLSKHNIYALFGRLKQFFSCFYHPIFEVTFCYLVELIAHPCIQ